MSVVCISNAGVNESKCLELRMQAGVNDSKCLELRMQAGLNDSKCLEFRMQAGLNDSKCLATADAPGCRRGLMSSKCLFVVCPVS